MDEQGQIVSFLKAVESWNKRRRNVNEIPVADVYLNLLYDIGGRLPQSMKKDCMNKKIPVDILNQSLENIVFNQLEYLVDINSINSDLVLDLLLLSMDKFLNNMLERLIIRKFQYSNSYGYDYYTSLVSDADQLKLEESKKTWNIIIGKKIPLRDTSLVLFNSNKVYCYDSIETTYNFLKSIDSNIHSLNSVE